MWLPQNSSNRCLLVRTASCWARPVDTGRSRALRTPIMMGCDRTSRIIGFVCLLLALPLIVFTNKAAWGVCNIEEQGDPNERPLEAWGVCPARDGDHDAGCDRRWLFSTLCLIPVGGLLAPGLYLTFFAC